ncbi:hypothetical protein GCM10009562_42360 [Nocardioides aquaticus]
MVRHYTDLNRPDFSWAEDVGELGQNNAAECRHRIHRDIVVDPPTADKIADPGTHDWCAPQTPDHPAVGPQRFESGWPSATPGAPRTMTVRRRGVRGSIMTATPPA